MRDMVPPEHRSIRNIPVPNNFRHAKSTQEAPELPTRAARAPTPEEVILDDMQDDRPTPMRARRQSGKRWFIISGVVVVSLCAIGGLLLSTLFAGATITVFARQQQVSPPSVLVAKLHPTSTELGFQILTVTRSATTTVAASGNKQVSRSASGLVTIYNSYDAQPQRLIANTRLEAPDGKIYRIHDSITVPGMVKGASGAMTPGSVSATVFADSPGASYNRADTRFTIPGFKGDPRYDKFYAQGSAIAGGFIGQEPAVASADLTKAGDTLKQSLSQAAQSSLASQIPAGFVAVPGTLLVTFSDIRQSPLGDGSAAISQSATMSGAILESSAFASAIARSTVSGYNGEPVAIADLSTITVAAATTTKPGDNVSIAVSGTPTLVWQYDAAALKAALLGKNKSTFQSIVESFAPAIVRAEAKVRPFWDGSFPSNPDKIDLVAGVQ